MYIIVELQKNGDQVANLVYTYASRYEAESKYHPVLSAAAISTVEVHSAVMLTEEGYLIKNESYRHMTEGEE